MRRNRRVAIKHISILSAFQVGATLHGLLFVIFGLIALTFYGLFISLYTGPANQGEGDLIGAILLYFLSTISFGLMGGIFSAIAALLYNLLADFNGGLKIELDESTNL